MRNLILSCLLLLLGLGCLAQGNLQFNQVLNYTMNTPYAAGNSRPTETLTITVAAGKVVKLESVHLSYQSASGPAYAIGNTSNPSGYVVLNGGIIAAFENGPSLLQGPIWLAAGTHTIVLQGYYNSSSNYRWNAFISGIEFNIVP